MKDNSRQSPPTGPQQGHRRGPMFARPVEKPKNFKRTLKRLLTYLYPFKAQLLLAVLTAFLSTSFTVLSPKIMGLATTEIFEGVLRKLEGAAGAAIDFSYILRILFILAALYTASAVFAYIEQVIMITVAQKTVYKMRNDVTDKLFRLPLKFFDTHTHGEILSRVTNDIDNISNTLQQSITQIIRSVVTLTGIVIMMLAISPPMTLILVVTLPLYVLVTKAIAKRSQAYFFAQQATLDELNGHIEEIYAGHKIIKAFSREEKAISVFDTINTRLYEAGWKAQFISGVIMPLMFFINNIGYVLISVAGGIMVTRSAIAIGDVQAFVQYSRQFTQPIIQTANIANILQSTAASAERVFELLNEVEELPDRKESRVIQNPKGEVCFRHVKFSYNKNEPLIEDLNIDVKPGQTVAIVC
ncbi:MAG: ABC transporter ATP-binding protein, partial [Firmicutes bacterium]|nr:ABC transporter ATP-binding protein [Bacillota bacterium]